VFTFWNVERDGYQYFLFLGAKESVDGKETQGGETERVDVNSNIIFNLLKVMQDYQ
jgi:hypothetical protein